MKDVDPADTSVSAPPPGYGPGVYPSDQPANTQAKKRVVAYIDGFNLYHALDALRRPHLKWVDLRKLCQVFIDPKLHQLEAVYYFSAFATWLPGPSSRHRQYVAALEASGVTPVMGHFKEKDRQCKSCGCQWKAHEEKETDVNAALYILNGAHQNIYDEAFVFSRDSDLAPAVRMVLKNYPDKKIKIIAPENLRHSKELAQAAGQKVASIREIHLERCLLPQHVLNSETGNIVATRPNEYAPPHQIARPVATAQVAP